MAGRIRGRHQPASCARLSWIAFARDATSYCYHVAAAELAVDRQVEQREVMLAPLRLQFGSDRPDVASAAVWPDDLSLVPRGAARLQAHRRSQAPHRANLHGSRHRALPHASGTRTIARAAMSEAERVRRCTPTYTPRATKLPLIGCETEPSRLSCRTGTRGNEGRRFRRRRESLHPRCGRRSQRFRNT
jgi:hypothetical protein